LPGLRRGPPRQVSAVNIRLIHMTRLNPPKVGNTPLQTDRLAESYDRREAGSLRG
jgi:hypothetical protein